MDWYRSCKFFSKRIEEDDIADAEAVLGRGRIRDVIGLNRCYEETVPIDGGGIGWVER